MLITSKNKGASGACYISNAHLLGIILQVFLGKNVKIQFNIKEDCVVVVIAYMLLVFD